MTAGLKRKENAMDQFIAKFHSYINGVLSGFDRLVFRGTLRALCGKPGMESYLAANKVLYKNFASHVHKVSQQLKKAALARAEREKRPIQYLASPAINKEDLARRLALTHPIKEGLLCVLSSVEPCQSFDIYRNSQSKKLELVQRIRKCLYIYQYWIHQELGWINARIQTWFPFRIQICINGRQWLARQMDRQGMDYIPADNCFPWVENIQEAQKLMNQQLKTPWPQLLDSIAAELNPLHKQIFERYQVNYYWSVYQSEWAIDVLFSDAEMLRRLYPRFIHHGITTLGSVDVLRFLGRSVPLSGRVPRNFSGELLTDLKQRAEGIRLKHGLNGNTVKVYDKAFTPVGSVLRFETTIHNGDDFRVYRPKEGDPNGPSQWRVLRRGIADLHRRAQVSHRAASRYMDAMATVDDDMTLEELTCKLENPVYYNARRVRGLRLFDAADRQLLQFISKGEFTLNGVRNRDLQALFFPTPAHSQQEKRRRSAWVSRRLRLLRAHGLLHRIGKTYRYQLTKCARRIITAILAACRATIAQLTAIPA